LSSQIPQIEGSQPRSLVRLGGLPFLERQDLIPTLHGGSVSEECADRIALRIVGVIEILAREPIDSVEERFADVREH
jgi:hypothetical protein